MVNERFNQHLRDLAATIEIKKADGTPDLPKIINDTGASPVNLALTDRYRLVIDPELLERFFEEQGLSGGAIDILNSRFRNISDRRRRHLNR